MISVLNQIATYLTIMLAVLGGVYLINKAVTWLSGREDKR